MKIQVRRGTASDWTSANPTLAAGEQGYETDTGRMKVGDGSTAWTSLAYRFEGSGVIENRTSDPGAPVSGQLWLRTDL